MAWLVASLSPGLPGLDVINTVGHATGLCGVRRQAKRDAALHISVAETFNRASPGFALHFRCVVWQFARVPNWVLLEC